MHFNCLQFANDDVRIECALVSAGNEQVFIIIVRWSGTFFVTILLRFFLFVRSFFSLKVWLVFFRLLLPSKKKVGQCECVSFFSISTLSITFLARKLIQFEMNIHTSHCFSIGANMSYFYCTTYAFQSFLISVNSLSYSTRSSSAIIIIFFLSFLIRFMFLCTYIFSLEFVCLFFFGLVCLPSSVFAITIQAHRLEMRCLYDIDIAHDIDAVRCAMRYMSKQ